MLAAVPVSIGSIVSFSKRSNAATVDWTKTGVSRYYETNGAKFTIKSADQLPANSTYKYVDSKGMTAGGNIASGANNSLAVIENLENTLGVPEIKNGTTVVQVATGLYADLQILQQQLDASTVPNQQLESQIQFLESLIGNDGTDGNAKTGLYLEISELQQTVGVPSSESAVATGLYKDIEDAQSKATEYYTNWKEEETRANGLESVKVELDSINEQLGEDSVNSLRAIIEELQIKLENAKASTKVPESENKGDITPFYTGIAIGAGIILVGVLIIFLSRPKGKSAEQAK